MKYEIIPSTEPDVAMKMDLTGLDFPQEVLNGTLWTFPLSSFNNLRRMDTSGNSKRYVDCGAFNIVNDFFNSISTNDKKVIALVLMVVHNQIHRAHEENGLFGMEKAIEDGGKLIRDKFMEISLMEKISDYVYQHITVDIEDDWGKRSIDTADKTYTRDDVLGLTKVVYLCKILTPLFGACVTRAKGYPIDTDAHKQICLPLIMPYINARAVKERDKLIRYIRAIGSASFKEDATALHSGHTLMSIEPKVMAIFLINKAVSHNLYRPNGKLIRVLLDAIQNVTKTYNKASSKDNRIESRKPTQAAMEERNESQLERDSVVSRRTADMKAITKVFAPHVVNDMLDDKGLDPDLHSELCEFILERQVAINPISMYVMQLLFCSYLGGITSLDYLTLHEMTGLIAATQQWVAVNKYTEIAHAITMQYSGYIKDSLTPIDHTMLQGFNRSRAFSRYVQLLNHQTLPPNVMKQLLQKHFTEMINDVTSKQYTYMTHPKIAKLIQEQTEEGSVIQFTSKLCEQMFDLMYESWDENML